MTFEKNRFYKMRLDCGDEILKMIDDAIKDYATVNKTHLNNLFHCVIMAQDENNDNYQFCKALTEWCLGLADTAKLIIDQAEAGQIVINTVEDVIKILPDFDYKKG